MAKAIVLMLLICWCWAPVHCLEPIETLNATEPTTWLFPILRFGPNNQKRDLRQLTALAKTLDCGIVLTGLFKHYLDVAKSNGRRPMGLQPGQPAGARGGAARRAAAANRPGGTISQMKPRLRGQEAGWPFRSLQPVDAQGWQGDPTRGERVKWLATGSRPGTMSAPPVQQQNGTANSTLPACFNSKNGWMAFDTVLDRPLLSSFLPVMTIDELRAKGWDGRIEAYMYRAGEGPDQNPKHKKQLIKALAATNTTMMESYKQMPVAVPMHCQENKINALKKQIEPFRVVAAMVFALDDHEFADYSLLVKPKPGNACKATLWEAEHKLRHAPWIQAAAKRYITEHLGSKPFLAVHVRPWPDDCLSAWEQPELDLEKLGKQCIKPLHTLLAGKVQEALTQFTDPPQVFVMAHPAIRKAVQQLLAKVNVTPVYLSEEVLYDLAQCTDNTATFMMMAEEEVAVQAHAFLGTASSSITQSIVVERLGVGNRNIQFMDSDIKSEAVKMEGANKDENTTQAANVTRREALSKERGGKERRQTL